MLLVLSMVGFVGSVSIARYASGTDDVEAEDDSDDRPGASVSWDWTTAADVLAAVCLLGGAFFALVAAIGVVRLPDLLSRMHAATKPQVIGLLLVVTGLALSLRDVGLAGHPACWSC